MQKIIVTTTINPPTEAIDKFAAKKDWVMYVIGDKKTPHHIWDQYVIDHPGVWYISPEDQEKKYPILSDIIGWNCIQRRAIGYILAIENGFDIIASVDDDNIPYDNWGEDLHIDKPTLVDMWESNNGLVFDPLSVTNHPELWHRGFPWQMVAKGRVMTYKGKKWVTPMVQADLWDGAPDIDALCRMVNGNPIVKFNAIHPFTASGYKPFNSQNTFFCREALKHYYLYPGVGRMDDIWGAYHLSETKMDVIYAAASVYQERNEQSPVKNLQDEMLGYDKTLSLLAGKDVLPDQAKRFEEEYARLASRT